MLREELIREILNFKPCCFKKEILDNLSDNELAILYNNNKYYKYYQNIIRQHKASVINYVYEGIYSDVALFSLDENTFEELYLSAIKMSRDEFELYLSEGLEDFRKRAAEENEDYLTFSREEQIIASGILRPADLLTQEEFVTKSVLLQIHELSEEIKQLEEENEKLDELIASPSCTSSEASSYESEQAGNNWRINTLRNRLKVLMLPNSNLSDDDTARKRHP